MNFDIALLIPVFNEFQIIKKTLSAFSKEADNRVLFVIVDNASNDNTREEIRKWQKENDQPLALLSENESGALYARRKGLFYSKDKAEVIISTDADCQPEKDFYRNIRNYFSKDISTDVLSGHLRHDAKTRLLKQAYLGKVMNLIAWQENIERNLFGPFFFGGYFGVRRSMINTLAFPSSEIPTPSESTVYWSKHCYYLGYKFTNSKPDIRASSRRFWSDPDGFFSGDRLNTSRHEIESNIAKKRLLESLKEREHELIELRHIYFSKRLLMFILDALYFRKKNQVKDKTIVTEVINTSCEYLNLSLKSVEALALSGFGDAKNKILINHMSHVLEILKNNYLSGFFL